ncbi:MAG: hypothetical protein KC503_16135 [Myxococcales bacterium]|nr:hypothetical protein [Myxococcales bacterium]
MGADAASIYRAELGRPAWVEGLLAAYCAARGRLVLQVVGLLFDDRAALEAALAEPPWAGLRDEAGGVLCERFARALAELSPPGCALAEPRVAPWLLDTVCALRAALWREERGASIAPPPLLLFHAPSLGHDHHDGRARATHGRAVFVGGAQRIAVDLDCEPEQLLCQIVHEATHVLTDPAVRARFEGVAQDTAATAGGDGFALHRALERAVVDRDQRLFETHAPRYLEAYARWRRRYGV